MDEWNFETGIVELCSTNGHWAVCHLSDFLAQFYKELCVCLGGETNQFVIRTSFLKCIMCQLETFVHQSCISA